jgi:hypothetical protein
LGLCEGWFNAQESLSFNLERADRRYDALKEFRETVKLGLIALGESTTDLYDEYETVQDRKKLDGNFEWDFREMELNENHEFNKLPKWLETCHKK